MASFTSPSHLERSDDILVECSSSVALAVNTTRTGFITKHELIAFFQLVNEAFNAPNAETAGKQRVDYILQHVGQEISSEAEATLKHICLKLNIDTSNFLDKADYVRAVIAVMGCSCVVTLISFSDWLHQTFNGHPEELQQIQDIACSGSSGSGSSGSSGSSFNNDYTGYTIPSPATPISRLTTAPTPQQFFQSYIKPRRPVVVESQIFTTTPSWSHNFQQWTSNAYLNSVAGHAKVRVETRTNNSTAFGQGKYSTMTFSSFLNLLDQGSTRHYLTTQDIDVDEEGRPAVMASPCLELSKDFPLVPPLAGNLIPMNVNIWMGNSSTSSKSSSGATSSGLHHDFHDNMYVLLRGKKRFRLFSPADASNLNPHGAIACVHSNGRICYANEMTHADGSTSEARQAMAVRQEIDAAAVELELAEESVEKGKTGSTQRHSLAARTQIANKERLVRAEERMDIAMERIVDLKTMEEEEEGEEAKDPAELKPTPQNFCKTWPSLQSTTMTEVELKAGDLLYLPAGWFHEVLSETTEENTGHMAFNYWFHPPDGETFESPYASSFWFADWKERRTFDLIRELTDMEL